MAMSRAALIGVLILPLAWPVAGHAQVSVNPDALDALHPSPSKDTGADRAEDRGEDQPAPPRHRPAAKAPADASSAAKPAPIPTTAPPWPDLPPPVVVPVRPQKPPPPPLVAPKADGIVVLLTGGIRITFGAGSATLNPETLAALHEFARQVGPDHSLTVAVNASATGSVEDQSTPRRLSLSRALAARNVLVADGIASDRITVRAMGATPAPDAEPGQLDRADILAYQRGTP